MNGKMTLCMKYFLEKKKIILVSLEQLSTFFNAFKFCNNPIQVKEYNDKSVGLAFFSKIVYQNEKYLKSKMNSSVNMSNKNGQFFWDQLSLLFPEHRWKKVSLV